MTTELDDDTASKMPLRILLTALVRSGRISIEGKSDTDILNETVSILEKIQSSGEVKIKPVIDYREELLKKARDFSLQDDAVSACIFYATWLEHWLNGNISTLAHRASLEDDLVVQIIRDTNIRAKTTWLLHLLGLPMIDKEHITAFTRLSEVRNSIVHYKWKPSQEWEDMDDLNKNSRDVICDIERSILYLQEYEKQHVNKGIDKIIERILIDEEDVFE